MAHDNRHHKFYALITQTLTTLGIKHEVGGAWGNDVIRVSGGAMGNVGSVVRKLQEACGASVIVYWNPADETVCIDDNRRGR